jgi:hypothetical protein
MISRFWLGECVWGINVVLWQNFGKEISVFDEDMRLERIGVTVHGAPAVTDRADRPPPPRGRSARPPAAAPMHSALSNGVHYQFKLLPKVNTH